MKIKVLVCDFYVNYDIVILNLIRWIIFYFFFLWYIEIFGCFVNYLLIFIYFISIEYVYKYRIVIYEFVIIVIGF